MDGHRGHRSTTGLLGALGALAASFGALAGIASCGSVVDEACTEIGCSDGIVVEVNGATSDLTIEATGEDGEQQTLTCQVSSGDFCFAQFAGFTPAQVTIRVAGDSQAIAVTLEPAYEVSQPNGPNCEPTCLTARVSIQLEP